MKVELIPIDRIKADRRAQPRVEIDQLLVDEYAEAMTSGQGFLVPGRETGGQADAPPSASPQAGAGGFPPVVIFSEGEDYWLADGFHRYLAARQAGLKEILAQVQGGGLREAILFSVGANCAHGLRRRNADKRRAVRVLLQDPEWVQWSDGRIACQCAVSDRFVANLRKELSPNGSEMERKVERGGQTYTMNTSRIGASQKLSPQVRNLLRDTDVADDRRQLAKLAEKSPEVQLQAAGILAQGKVKRVYEALKEVAYHGKLNSAHLETVEGRYPVIYADPPWRFDSGEGLEGDVSEHYPTMATEDICALSVAERTTSKAVLFMWTTNAHLPEALRVIDSWGFRYVTNLVWVKNTFGTGHYLRGKHELLLLGVKGSMLPKNAPPSVFMADTRGHSVKPDEVYRLIDEVMYPGQPGYLELFARRPPTRPRWTAWGNEPGITPETPKAASA